MVSFQYKVCKAHQDCEHTYRLKKEATGSLFTLEESFYHNMIPAAPQFTDLYRRYHISAFPSNYASAAPQFPKSSKRQRVAAMYPAELDDAAADSTSTAADQNSDPVSSSVPTKWTLISADLTEADCIEITGDRTPLNGTGVDIRVLLFIAPIDEYRHSNVLYCISFSEKSVLFTLTASVYFA